MITKKKIDVFDYANKIIRGIKESVSLTTKAEGRINTMTISWGMLGIEQSVPVFTTFVREGRFSREQLDCNGEFTINIPYSECDRRTLAFCDTKSGRNTDKIKAAGLTLIDADMVTVPAIE